MTIYEALEKVDKLVPNQYERDEKLGWLSRLDGEIFREIISRAETYSPEEFSGYTEETDIGTALLVPWPYDYDVYLGYLEAMIHRFNGENARYNIAAGIYNSARESFGNWYRRTHRPARGGKMVV